MGLHELRLVNFRIFPNSPFTPTPRRSPSCCRPTAPVRRPSSRPSTPSRRRRHFAPARRATSSARGRAPARCTGCSIERERRVQVDLTLTRGVRNTTKRMLVNGQRPRSRADVAEALPLTIFTPEGVDVVRQGPEHRREFLTNLLTDVDLTTGDVIERFTRILSQRNALLRHLQGERPTSIQQGELDVWTSDFCKVSEELVTLRRALLDEVAPLVSNYYHELAEDDSTVGVSYEQSWSGDLERALRDVFDDDRFRGHTTIGPQRDDIALTLDGRDTRRQASQGEQRSLALAIRLAGHELVQRRRGVDPLLAPRRRLQRARSAPQRPVAKSPPNRSNTGHYGLATAGRHESGGRDRSHRVGAVKSRDEQPAKLARTTRHTRRTTPQGRSSRHRRDTNAVAEHRGTGDRRALSTGVREERRATRECPFGGVRAARDE